MKSQPTDLPNTLDVGRYIAFAGTEKIAEGALPEVARSIKAARGQDGHGRVIVFEWDTAYQVELDLRGSLDDVQARAQKRVSERHSPPPETERPPKTKRGRPRLGVTAHEVTLLPRHWAWLKSQPGGASVTLRKLVERARREGAENDARRRSQDATYRFMSVVAGDLPGYEEALRALYSADANRYSEIITSWPADLGPPLRQLAAAAFAEQDNGPQSQEAPM